MRHGSERNVRRDPGAEVDLAIRARPGLRDLSDGDRDLNNLLTKLSHVKHVAVKKSHNVTRPPVEKQY